MPLQNSIQYTNAANFTFSNQLVTFPGTNAQLKNIRPANSTFYAGYHQNINGEYGNGVLTGTANGAPTVAGNTLILNGGLNYVDYAATSNANSAQVGCIRFQVIPQYSGAPSNYQIFCAVIQANGSLNSIMQIYHGPTGALYLFCSDQAGVLITNPAFGGFSPVAGTTYEIELDYDFNAGATRLFVNGIQLGATDTATGTRSPAQMLILRTGTDYTHVYNADFNITNLIVFDAVQHTSNFPGEIPRVAETQYSTQSPAIVVNASQAMSGLTGFSETAIKPANTEIQYYLIVNGQPKYFNGVAWVNSDTSYAQSNLASVINTNASSLDLSAGANVQVAALLNSTYGNATPVIVSVLESYLFFINPPVAPPECVVYAFLTDIIGGTSVQQAELVVELPQATVVGGYVVAAFKTSVPFNALGYANVSLIATAVPNAYNFSVTYLDAFNTQRTVAFQSVPVPNQPSASLTAITSIITG